MNHDGHEPNIEIWVALMQAQGALASRASERLESEVGIPLAWHDVLVRLAFAPEGRMRMQELADSLTLSKSGLTRLCDRLEAAGLIERASCKGDRRGVHAVLTAAGRAKFEQAGPVFNAVVEEVLGSLLPAREREGLKRSLTTLIEANGGQVCWKFPAKLAAAR